MPSAFPHHPDHKWGGVSESSAPPIDPLALDLQRRAQDDHAERLAELLTAWPLLGPRLNRLSGYGRQYLPTDGLVISCNLPPVFLVKELPADDVPVQ